MGRDELLTKAKVEIICLFERVLPPLEALDGIVAPDGMHHISGRAFLSGKVIYSDNLITSSTSHCKHPLMTWVPSHSLHRCSEDLALIEEWSWCILCWIRVLPR